MKRNDTQRTIWHEGDSNGTWYNIYFVSDIEKSVNFYKELLQEDIRNYA